MAKKNKVNTKTENKAPANAAADEKEDLDALLSKIEQDTAPSTDDVAALLADVENDEVKAEAYAKQESTSDVNANVEAPAANKDGVEKSTKTAKTPKAPKAPAFTSARDAVEKAIDAGKIDAKSVDLASLDGIAKKVGEKAVNVVQALMTNRNLSVYTQVALRELVNSGSMSSGQLASVYQATQKPNKTETYSKGTANAQAQQMAALFPALGIAVKYGKALKLADTPQAKALASLVAAAA